VSENVEKLIQLTPELVQELRLPPIWWWDPIPPWLKLDERVQERYAKLQLDFKIKEMEIQLEKMKALQELTKK